MRIFENQEERNQYELESLLKLVNNQRSIYSISFNEGCCFGCILHFAFFENSLQTSCNYSAFMV